MVFNSTSIGYQSAALEIAESAERFSQFSRIGEVAAGVPTGVHHGAISSYYSAAARLQEKVRSALAPSIAAAAQLQQHQSKLAIALAPITEASEKLRELSEAIKINTSFQHLDDAPAFTQIRCLEELTGSRILNFDEEQYLNKITFSHSFEPIGARVKIDADCLPLESSASFIGTRTSEEPDNECRTFKNQSSFFDHKTDRGTKFILEPDYRPHPDYLSIIADRNLALEERGRAFALSGLPFSFWSDHFCLEEFETWAEDEVEAAKQRRERILSLANKINQAYRRACRVIIQSYRRLARSWKKFTVFSWRYAHLDQIHTLKDVEIKLSHFFISITSRLARESSFIIYGYYRKYHCCI